MGERILSSLLPHARNKKARVSALLRDAFAGLACAGATAAIVVLSAGTAAPASAHSWGPDTGVAWGDDGTVDYCYLWLEGGYQAPIETALYDRVDGPTDLRVVPTAGGCNSGTDIRIYVGVDISTLRGNFQCQRFRSSNVCESGRMYLNRYQLGEGNTTSSKHQIRKTTCHEAGHAVGLNHYDYLSGGNGWGCMISGSVPSGSSWENYSAHEINEHINKRY